MRIIFCAAQKGKERRGVVVIDGGGNQVYSLTFLSRVRAFAAVGTLAKCVVVFVSCYGRKCRGVWSSVTQLSSARNSESLVPNFAVVENSLWEGFVFRWHKAFKDGRERVEDEQRAGRLSASRN